MTKASRIAALLVSVLLLLAVAGVVGAGFATSYVVLKSQARGLIPNVSGPIKAKVASNVVLSLLFSINAGSGYVAGPVTATTNTKGQILKLVKLRQTCTFTYTLAGAVAKVTCGSSRRELEGGALDNHEEIDPAEEDLWQDPEQGEPHEGGARVHRRLATCSSCIDLVKDSFPTGIRAVCGVTVANKISLKWAKSAAAALCGMATKLGTPVSLAYKTCRCSCRTNAECPSLVCSRGVCLAQKLAAGQRCYDDDDDDCLNEHCARSSYPSGQTICCLSGAYVYSSIAGDYYCQQIQANGASCDSLSNEMCKSGVCSEGECLTRRFEPGEPCPDYYDDDDCSNNRCALDTYPSGDPVCCLSGDYVYSFDQRWFYCTGMATGDDCESFTNEMCASGVCSDGKCLEKLIEPGDPCPDYYDDYDCSNGSCARESYPSGDPVCCVSGDYEYSVADGEYYCTGIQGDGDPCEPLTNGMCTSGVCSEGKCVAQKFGVGEPCPDLDDNDCANGRCARGSYPSGNPVCCSSNSSVNSPRQGTYYCTGIQGSGAECDANEMCSVGICSGGFCIDQKFGVGENCPDFENNDCLNAACARISYPSGGPVCCPSNSVVYSTTTGDYFCTGIQGVGSSCDSNEICSSGVCSNGLCTAGT